MTRKTNKFYPMDRSSFVEATTYSTSSYGVQAMALVSARPCYKLGAAVHATWFEDQPISTMSCDQLNFHDEM